MKKKNISKKVLAVLLSFVMIATSVPLGIMSVAADVDKYDPAPYFSTAAHLEGARAWLDDEGNVQVTFPAAGLGASYAEYLTEIADDGKITEDEKALRDDIPISFYILELVDMGEKSASHKNTVLDTIKVTGTSGTFAAADIGTIDLENSRYSVTVAAVDEENWFSQPIYTTVTDVPVAEIDESRFANFSTSDTAVREIMTFEEGTDDGNVTGEQLLYMGVAAEAGTEDLTDNVGDTSALRFIMYNQPTGTQAFDTSYSRQTWDFNGAEEIWYWLDLTDVELTGLAFRLRTNEKTWLEWNDDDETLDTTQRAGETIYSTKGTAASTYTGEDPYVYVQRTDGGWNKVMLKADGTLDIGNFKGYIRVPLDFICSETATYVDISNQELAVGTNYKGSLWNGYPVDEAAVNSWLSSLILGKVTVDPAGTSISEALLIHRRGYLSSSGAIGTGTRHLFLFDSTNGITHLTSDYPNNPAVDYSKTGYMLAVPLDPAQAKTSVTTGNASTDRAYVSGTTVMNREGGLKAIEDIYNAGFSIEGCSADSLEHSFFVDNIFFYRSDGKAYSENTLDGNVNTGNPMSTYYNEELEISRIIFDEIDKYIEDPDWADYRQLEYILELIEEYRALYVSQGKDTSFLNLTRQPDTTGLAGMAATLNRTETWEKAWLAYEACATEGTIDASQANVTDWFISNGDKYDLVPSIVNTMEKLPHPDNITAVSEALRKEIVKLWQAYSLLNLGQLEMLGKVEEETLLKYFTLVENLEELDGDKFVVGQRLADNPFIVFNDFENYSLGETAWQLEDNKDAYTTGFTSENGSVAGTSNLANDWRHTKSLVTYTTNGSQNIVDADYYGYVTTDDDKSQEAMDGKLYYNASTATITNEGYLHSKGVNLYSDASFTSNSGYKGTFHTITITKDGQPIGTNYENNMVGEQLGSLAQSYSAAASTSVPLALIFYVDFTQIEDFNFSINVFTRDADGNHVKCRADTGLLNADRKYWILDNETGEWEIIYTTNQYAFNSSGNQDESTNQGVEYNKIEGYRGYLMVPLYHIKAKDGLLGTSGTKLDENSALLNNIFAIQFCIGGVNATDMDEKSIIIDNVGFTYSKDSYTAAASRTDKSYAEVFGAKSLPALNFEAAVDAIDPYDETTIDTTTAAARAIYNTLPTYQQNVVIDAYKTLLVYEGYAADHSTIPQPAESSDSLATWITENLNSYATGAKVTGVEKDTDGNEIDYDLMYPGYVIENGVVVPNYALYGLTADLAAQIVEFYNNSYVYYTVAEKNAVKDLGFLNAYNAAMRCSKSLEDIKQDSLTFLPEITALYTVKYDYNDDGVLDDKDDSVANSDDYKVGNFVYIGEKNADGEYEGVKEVSTFKTDKYDPLQYYSKTSIDDGTIYPQLTNTSRGFTYFLNNTREFVVDGETIEGGILTFQQKMQDIYEMANEYIENKTLFTDAELQSVRDVINEYNAMLPAYYNVEELYELEQAILNLFPTYQAVMGEQTLFLSPDTDTNSTTYTIEYSEYLDLTDPYSDTYYVKVLSENGALVNDYGESTSYNVTLGSSADNTFTVDASALDELDEGAWYATYPVTNNYSTPDGVQQVYKLDVEVPDANKPDAIQGMLSDTLTLQLCLPDGTVVEEQVVQVFYSMADTYTVTIPANIPVKWDDSSAQDVSYSVTTQMVATSKLTVGVTSDGTGKLTTDMDANLKLDYTTENFVDTEFGNMVTAAKPDPKPTVSVSGWDDVPVGEYKTILTYTVVYDDGSDDGTT